MTTLLVIEEEVGADGKIILEFPPGKRIRIQVDEVTEVVEPQYTPEEIAADEKQFEELMNDPTTFTGLGLSAEEVAQSPEFGAWAHRTDIQDGESYVETLRSKKRYTW